LDDVATKEFDEAELVRLELMHPIEEKAQQAIQREMELKEAAAARFSEAALLIDPNEFKGGVVGEMAFDKIRETCLTLNENIKSLLKLREVVFVNVFKKLHENYENDANDQAVVDETMVSFPFFPEIYKVLKPLKLGGNQRTAADSIEPCPGRRDDVGEKGPDDP